MISIPKISLPKGGGAIKGIGETFQPNVFSGTGTYSIPLPLPTARGFEPKLTLQYNSGAGNGIFGLGFDLSLPKISIRTEKGIPKYDGTDTFMSGAHVLVPKAEGSYARDGYMDYVPRIQKTFSRIRHYLSTADKHVSYWEITNRNNETSVFGKSDDSRICNPDDKNEIFEWLIQKSTDPKGNKIVYRYKEENGDGLSADRYEQGQHNYCNKYISQVQYGNHGDGANEKFCFEIVFDYGERQLPSIENPTLQSIKKWISRPDPFSSFKSGFEIRTTRLCEKILIYHHFEDELGDPCLEKSITLNYSATQNYQGVPLCGPSHLRSLVLTGYRREGRLSSDPYEMQCMPALEFTFSEFKAPKKSEFNQLRVDTRDIPGYLDSSGFMPIDLHGEGISGLLYTNDNSLLYLSPKGNGEYSGPTAPDQFPIHQKFRSGTVSLRDLDGNGELELVVNNSIQSGYYQRVGQDQWGEFESFNTYPTDHSNRDMEMVGLNGNGKTDLILAQSDKLTVYHSVGKRGYSASQEIDKVEGFPSTKRDYYKEHIGFGNFLGDGLSHRVKISNGRVECWPNLGHGRFGEKIEFDNAPEYGDKFDARRLHLADINGSGTLDIIYVNNQSAKVFFNENGNRFTDAIEILLPIEYTDIDKISFADIKGTGTTCMIFTKISPSPVHYYYDFAGQVVIDNAPIQSFKPYLLHQIDNNRGAITQIQYCSSTKFYLEDKAANRPWITRLPFPVQLVEKTIAIDQISGSRFTHCFKYHDGYYDHIEREFRGFGYVESWDTEEYNNKAEGALNAEDYVQPIYTRTWHHTGAVQDEYIVDQQYNEQYFKGDAEAYTFPPSIICGKNEHDPIDDPEVRRQAYAALHGHVMRSEVYGLDKSKNPGNPYRVQQSNVKVTLHQDKGKNKFAVFMVHDRESITYHYDQDAKDPRTEQHFTLQTDAFGNTLQACKVFLPRRHSDGVENSPEQYSLKAILSKTRYVKPIESYLFCHVPCEEETFQVSGIKLLTAYVSFEDLMEQFSREDVQNRQLTWHRHYFWNESQTEASELGRIGSISGSESASSKQAKPEFAGEDISDSTTYSKYKALYHSTEKAVFSAKQLELMLGEKLTNIDLEYSPDTNSGKHIGAGYKYDDHNGYWWDPGSIHVYTDTANFCLPSVTIDALKSETKITYDSFHLRMLTITDAYQNVTEGSIDYHTQLPWRIKDINGNSSEVKFDPLGMVVVTSVYGGESDNIRGDKPLQVYEIPQTKSMEDVLTNPRKILQYATSYLYYEHRFIDGVPPHSISLLRETHSSELEEGKESNIQIHIGYYDGFGRTWQTKTKAGPVQCADLTPNNTEIKTHADVRWLTSGGITYNNKGKVVKQFEPLYTDRPDYIAESLLHQHGTPRTTHYDPLLRVIGITNRDGSFSKVDFTPWEEKHYDENDTHSGGEGQAPPSFFDTPEIHRLDNQGRAYQIIQVLDAKHQLISHHEYDIEGREISNIDPRGVVCFEHTYDMLGKIFLTKNAETGSLWTLHNVMGKPIHIWDSRNFRTSTIYDHLHRPVRIHVSNGDGKTPLDNTVELIIYGEGQSNDQLRNLRGKIFKHYDQVGLLEYDSYDIKGKPVQSTRRLTEDYRHEPNWIQGQEEELLEDLTKNPHTQKIFTSQWKHDALGRLVQEIYPDGSISEMQYHPEGWLKQLTGKRINPTDNEQRFIESIRYNARGQRTDIRYLNGVTSRYTYDVKTHRLTNLKTIRTEDNSRDCHSETVKKFGPGKSKLWDTTPLQDLHYTYDLVGNITKIRDDAQQTHFFKGQVISPVNTYTYDALYRLRNATGREHIDQAQTAGHNSEHKYLAHVPQPSNGRAMRAYTEHYDYDDSGNINRIAHRAVDGSWTRTLHYDESSAIYPNQSSNKLTTCKIGNATRQNSEYEYDYDPHGNMTTMPHLHLMIWDHYNQLRVTQKQREGNGSTEKTWYLYDATGKRVRQVTDIGDSKKQSRTRLKERIYIGGFEIYREFKGGSAISLERATLHIKEDKQRIALIEKQNIGPDPKPTILTRYQLSNHLDSVSLELDENANILSYEEYTPFGTTSYQAVRSQTSCPKRYRYSGKERDESTGLYYYGFRYYSPWLCRWINPDPAKDIDGLNLISFVRGNPIRFFDDLGHVGKDATNKIIRPESHMKQAIDTLNKHSRRALFVKHKKFHEGLSDKSKNSQFFSSQLKKNDAKIYNYLRGTKDVKSLKMDSKAPIPDSIKELVDHEILYNGAENIGNFMFANQKIRAIIDGPVRNKSKRRIAKNLRRYAIRSATELARGEEKTRAVTSLLGYFLPNYQHAKGVMNLV